MRSAGRLLLLSAAMLLPPLSQAGCGCDCDQEMANYRSVSGEPDTVISHLESAIFRYKERGVDVYFIWGDQASTCCDVFQLPISMGAARTAALDSARAARIEVRRYLEELLY